ncbi:hypothetical protein QO002_004413 [Pararhizobium capsulatum DSM 1112]|uniref:DUF982 domain-containing protein n=1 Tax=Pararhizobium capsulatum DSM 1112 TaxID=1121113 RepID=A0ABU0BZE3_9HYPH|nr:hypothetical protein [Pararhizobium capsulatum]MDQ0322207.1 hypothetical protein [Pararhizobium capsulatum DSM 1112]
MATSRRPLRATFIYNDDTRTMSVTIEEYSTVLGPFKDQDEAAIAAHAFCIEQAGLVDEAESDPSLSPSERLSLAQLFSAH